MTFAMTSTSIETVEFLVGAALGVAAAGLLFRKYWLRGRLERNDIILVVFSIALLALSRLKKIGPSGAEFSGPEALSVNNVSAALNRIEASLQLGARQSLTVGAKEAERKPCRYSFEGALRRTLAKQPGPIEGNFSYTAPDGCPRLDPALTQFIDLGSDQLQSAIFLDDYSEVNPSAAKDGVSTFVAHYHMPENNTGKNRIAKFTFPDIAAQEDRRTLTIIQPPL
jgi:hypothetical protein